MGALVVYRIGTFIPVPGINPSEVARFFTDQSNTIYGIVNMFSGGALSRLSIFAMGGDAVYFKRRSSIQMDVDGHSVASPELRKEGESSRRKRSPSTRVTRPVAIGARSSHSQQGALARAV